MKKNVLLTGLGLVLAVCAVMVSRMACANDTDSRLPPPGERVTPVLNSFLGPCGARVGSPVFLRAVKEDSLLELWVKPDKGELLRTRQTLSHCRMVRRARSQAEGRGQTDAGGIL